MNKESIKKLLGFFVSYRRYFGAAVLFVVFVLILVNCTGQSTSQVTPISTEEISDSTEHALTEDLDQNVDSELVELIKNYYEAYASANLETLETLAQPLGDNEKSYIGAFSDYYEEFQNITCYSMQGATEDSYLVSVCYDLKFYEVDTPAPGMDFFYVERDGKGNLIINNLYSAYNFAFAEEEKDDNLYTMIVAYEKSDAVVALQDEVQTRYEEALKSDEKLASMVGGTMRDVMAKWRESIASDTQVAEAEQTTEQETETKEEETEKSSEAATEKDTEKTTEKDTEKTTEQEETQKKETTEETGKVKTKDICKVRKGPGTDTEVLGTVLAGVKLNKLGTEGDWTKVEFQGSTGYIKSSLLKNVKKKS
jgi:hypothetical protein